MKHWKPALDPGSRADRPRLDFHLQPSVSIAAGHGRDPPTSKRSRPKVSWFERQRENRRTDGRTEAIALPPVLTRPVNF